MLFIRRYNQMAKVLIVDDAAFMRMMIKDCIISGGHEVVGEAVNGKDAVEKYGLSLTEIGTLKRGEDVVREDGTVIRLSDAAYRPYSPRSYAYVSDTAPFPELSSWVKGVDILYHEATYVGEYEDKAVARHHSTTFQAATVAREAGAGKLIVGHYSSRCRDLSLFEAECKSIFPDTHAASDGEVFDVPMKDKVERAGR